MYQEFYKKHPEVYGGYIKTLALDLSSAFFNIGLSISMILIIWRGNLLPFVKTINNTIKKNYEKMRKSAILRKRKRLEAKIEKLKKTDTAPD